MKAAAMLLLLASVCLASASLEEFVAKERQFQARYNGTVALIFGSATVLFFAGAAVYYRIRGASDKNAKNVVYMLGLGLIALCGALIYARQYLAYSS
ncbi:MAG: hypothetical protein AB1529_04320 [Candidatus Micrarchaeota archaeon]